MPTMRCEIHKVFTASATKGADGTNTFTLSTKDVDRDGDRIDPSGWNLTAYRQNPVVLYGHDHKSLPIGKCSDIRVVGGKLKGVVEWPPAGCYPFADQVKALVNAGFLRSASVGFRSDASSPNADGGRDIHAATLLEWSIVNIPSNPSAQLERTIDQVQFKSWLGNSWREQPKEDDMPYLEIDDEPYLELKDDDPFEQMCQQMLAAYEEMTGAKFRELMARQLATLGPAGKIDDFVRAMCRDGVVASRSWTPEPFDIDENELATVIAHVIATEAATQTRAALNAITGRLD